MGLRGDERVLDYGSGSGAAARHLAKRLQAGGGRLTCMDVSARWQAVIRKVLRGYPDVEFRLGDVRDDGPAGGELRRRARPLDAARRRRPGTGRRSSPSSRGCCARAGACSRASRRAPKHGMPAAQAREVYAAAGLSESLATEGKAPIFGEYYRAVWTKPRPDLRRRPAGSWRSVRRAAPASTRESRRRCRRLPRPPPLRGSPETPPDSGSGISATNERGRTFRGLPRIAQATGCCCVTQWTLPSALASSSVGTWTTVRRGEEARQRRRAPRRRPDRRRPASRRRRWRRRS